METVRVKVARCRNTKCRFHIDGECITEPDMDLSTRECQSNTGDIPWFILIYCIINNEEEKEQW